MGSTCSTAFPQRTMESRLYENAMVQHRGGSNFWTIAFSYRRLSIVRGCE